MSESETLQGERARTRRNWWVSVEMRHLAALVAVARESSFSDAADSLGYVPTAVHRQIAHLERLVGEKLTASTGVGKTVTLTEQGVLLHRHAQAILGELHLAKQDIDALQGDIDGALTVGVSSLFGEWLSAALVGSGAFADQAASLKVQRGRSEGVLRALEAGDLDAALVVLPVRSGPFSTMELMSIRYVLALPPTSVELVDLPLVEIADCRATPALRRRLEVPEGSGGARYAVETPASALALVRAGVAAAVVSESDAASDEVVRLVPMDDLPPRVVGLAWHRARDGDPTLAMLQTRVRSVVEAAEP